MTKMLAAVGAALILTVAVTSADARTRHHQTLSYSNEVPSFDRHTGGYTSLDIPRDGSEVRHHRHRPYITQPPSGYRETRVARHRERASPSERAEGHRLVASTGARTSVSLVAHSHFACLIGKLEAAGYRIDFMGGYASRGNSSAHPTGNALDINQTGRNVVTRRLPGNATQLAQECGLVHGATWSNPDQGHFEMARKYGYVYGHRRTRYAQARWG